MTGSLLRTVTEKKKTSVWKSPDHLRKDKITRPFFNGVVQGHKTIADGSRMNTSPIKWVFRIEEDVFLLTRTGTVYKLGLINSDYDRIYENSIERILLNFVKRAKPGESVIE